MRLRSQKIITTLPETPRSNRRRSNKATEKQTRLSVTESPFQNNVASTVSQVYFLWGKMLAWPADIVLAAHFNSFQLIKESSLYSGVSRVQLTAANGSHIWTVDDDIVVYKQQQQLHVFYPTRLLIFFPELNFNDHPKPLRWCSFIKYYEKRWYTLS